MPGQAEFECNSVCKFRQVTEDAPATPDQEAVAEQDSKQFQEAMDSVRQIGNETAAFNPNAYSQGKLNSKDWYSSRSSNSNSTVAIEIGSQARSQKPQNKKTATPS